MRELHVDEIVKLAQQPRVKQVAVQNFLMSMGDNHDWAIQNLRLDSKLYGWNHETYNAILDGIKLAEEGGK